MGFLKRDMLAPSSSEGRPSPLSSRRGWKHHLFPPALHDGEQDTAQDPVGR